MGTNLKCFTAQVNTPPNIPNGIKLNETIHQGKNPNHSNVFSSCTCEYKKSWLLDGKGKGLQWRCYAVVHKKMKSETSKYFAGLWVLCCLQCTRLKVSFSEL